MQIESRPRATLTILAPTALLAVNFILLGLIIAKLGPCYSRLSPDLCEPAFPLILRHFFPLTNITDTRIFLLCVRCPMEL
jgi:hypothetical protein